MSFTLLLLRVPPGASDEDVGKIAIAMEETERLRVPGPRDPEKSRRKRALVDALLTNCPELSGGEPDYAELARAENISEEQARQQFDWWTVTGPEEGAGIEITLYDDYVSIEMPSAAGTDQDWRDVGRYLEILVNAGGFVVWDPQGSEVVDPAAAPFGDGQRSEPPPSDDRDVEPEDVRRGGEIAKLINRIVDDGLAGPLAAAGFRRSGRTWRRTLDNGLIHVVNVQWSPRDGGIEGIFALSAGVYSRELAESIALFKPTDSPREHDCQVRLRAGPQGHRGWRVRVPGMAKPDSDIPGFLAGVFSWLDRRADSKAGAHHEKATREAGEAITGHLFPAFERLRTLRDLRDHLARSPDLYWAAHASLLIGDREGAKQLLERALEKARGNPEFSKLVRGWGIKQGLF